MIFSIQKCSIHDGDGLRTLVFFKGCPLKCLWCANPESLSYQPEIMESPVRCIACEACKAACPNSAISGGYSIDRSLCAKCFKCVDICYAESKRIAGKNYSIEELYKEIEKDRPFYSLYGGGVTFTGGEPLTHASYLKEIANKCHDNRINVVVESCGYGNYEDFKQALPYIDAMFIDIKHIDPTKHKMLTGMDNALILDNTRRISEFGIPITVRTPIVPGYTDTLENISGISEFISTIPTIKEYELLPYHNLGESKYNSLGTPYALKGVSPPSSQEMGKLVECSNKILQSHGKECFFVKDNTRRYSVC